MQPAHPQPSLDRGQLAKLFQLTGVWLLVFLALFFLSTALLYFLRVTIGPASFLPGLLLSMPAGWLLARRSRRPRSVPGQAGPLETSKTRAGAPLPEWARPAFGPALSFRRGERYNRSAPGRHSIVNSSRAPGLRNMAARSR